MRALLPLGLAVIFIGLVISTDRAERWWKSRHNKPQSAQPIPPFLTSLHQCRDCGSDTELLSLERRCLGCHQLHYGGVPHA